MKASASRKSLLNVFLIYKTSKNKKITCWAKQSISWRRASQEQLGTVWKGRFCCFWSYEIFVKAKGLVTVINWQLRFSLTQILSNSPQFQWMATATWMKVDRLNILFNWFKFAGTVNFAVNFHWIWKADIGKGNFSNRENYSHPRWTEKMGNSIDIFV